MTEQLVRFSIFEGLGPEDLAAIKKLCKTKKFQKGEQIFKEGEQATSLFLVCAGEIELRSRVSYYSATVEIPFEIKVPRAVFGWSAVTHPHKYTLSAYAKEDSEVLQISQADIQHLCETNIRLGYIVMKNTARIIGGRFQTLQAALAKEIQDRLRSKDSLA